MIYFDSSDPYPLIDLMAVPYQSQKDHAAQVDEWLGFEIESVESAIELQTHPRERIREQWIGLPPQSLQTPYVELRRILEQLKLPQGAILLDIGAAYGRMGFVMDKHAPQAKFVGIEICADRVREGQRVYSLHGLKNASLHHGDILSQSTLPEADVYFVYDFGPGKSIESLLVMLRSKARSRKITVVGRGRACRDQIEREHPWLSQVVPPVNGGNFSIYRTS